jgi:hypothetical protein
MTTVRTTEKFSVYWNYQVWPLAKGQAVVGGLADYLLETSSPVELVDEPTPPLPDPDAVPDGTIAQVVDWVGEDSGKAARALEVEQAADKPRSTLVETLQKLANPTT